MFDVFRNTENEGKRENNIRWCCAVWLVRLMVWCGRVGTLDCGGGLLRFTPCFKACFKACESTMLHNQSVPSHMGIVDYVSDLKLY